MDDIGLQDRDVVANIVEQFEVTSAKETRQFVAVFDGDESVELPGDDDGGNVEAWQKESGRVGHSGAKLP